MTRRQIVILLTLAVVANFALVVWHLVLVERLLPAEAPANLQILPWIVGGCSLVGVVVLWTRLSRIAGWLLMAILVIGLLVGGNEHFIARGPFNMFTMFTLVPERWALQFAVSCVLLAIIEIAGIWFSVRVATTRAQLA